MRVKLLGLVVELGCAILAVVLAIGVGLLDGFTSIIVEGGGVPICVVGGGGSVGREPIQNKTLSFDK